MANTYGGIILVGVQDGAGAGRLVGVGEEAIVQIINACHGALEPPWEPEVVPVPLDDGTGKLILVVRVGPARAPPADPAQRRGSGAPAGTQRRRGPQSAGRAVRRRLSWRRSSAGEAPAAGLADGSGWVAGRRPSPPQRLLGPTRRNRELASAFRERRGPAESCAQRLFARKHAHEMGRRARHPGLQLLRPQRVQPGQAGAPRLASGRCGTGYLPDRGDSGAGVAAVLRRRELAVARGRRGPAGTSSRGSGERARCSNPRLLAARCGQPVRHPRRAPRRPHSRGRGSRAGGRRRNRFGHRAPAHER
jgi:hypothetical protein